MSRWPDNEPTKRTKEELVDELLFDLHHVVRSKVCTMDGILNLMKLEEVKDAYGKLLMEKMIETVESLRNVTIELSKKYEEYEKRD